MVGSARNWRSNFDAVRHLVAHTEGRTEAEGIGEWGAEGDIWA